MRVVTPPAPYRRAPVTISDRVAWPLFPVLDTGVRRYDGSMGIPSSLMVARYKHSGKVLVRAGGVQLSMNAICYAQLCHPLTPTLSPIRMRARETRYSRAIHSSPPSFMGERLGEGVVMPESAAKVIPGFKTRLRSHACWLSVFALSSLLLAIATPAVAQVDNEKTVPGAVCSGTQNAADWDSIFQCSGGTWQRSAYFFGTVSAACDTNHAGLTRYNGGVLQLCNGTAWVILGDMTVGYLPNHNTALGIAALSAVTTGAENSAFGASTLNGQTTANQNTHVGSPYAITPGNINGSDNTGFGSASMFSAISGSGNTGFGLFVLSDLHGGNGNTALGNYTQRYTSTGSANTAAGQLTLGANTSGSANTAMGLNAMQNSTAATNNSIFGDFTAGSMTTATGNTGIGLQVFNNTTTGSNNTAIGDQAFYSLVTGTGNTAVMGSGYITGSNNTSFGQDSFNGASTATGSIFFGDFSGYGISTGSNNVGFGQSVMQHTATGNGNVAMGWNAMYGSGTNGASNNVAFGENALYGGSTGAVAFGKQALGAGYIVSGGGNVGVGYLALHQMKTSTGNTFLGHATAYTAASNGGNTGFGKNSQYYVTGTNNTSFGDDLVGSSTLASITSGSSNTAIGGGALGSNGTASNNTGVGIHALYNAGATGTGKNTAIGSSANVNETTGTGNTAIGYSSGAAIVAEANNINLGQGATVAANKTKWLSIGNFIEADMTSSLMGLGVTSFKTGLTLDVSIGYTKLKLNSSAPATCDAAHNGSIALTNTGYPACICTTGNSWVQFHDGAACSW